MTAAVNDTLVLANELERLWKADYEMMRGKPWDSVKHDELIGFMLRHALVFVEALRAAPVRASSAPPCTPQSLHWLGERVEAEQTHHHPDMRGLVMYFDRQSDCLNFMRWLERQPSSPGNQPIPREQWEPWQTHLFETVYGVAVLITGDQPIAHEIAEGAVQTASKSSGQG